MKNYFIIIILVSVIFQSCYKEPDFTNFDYDTYNRVVGPWGGVVDFYSNYYNDAKYDVLVRLEVPRGALDSVMVFNMYQHEEYELVMQMDRGFSTIGSKFLYFVPFYESQGYHERSQLDISYHLSTEFNEPVTVTYNFLADQALSAESWQEAELYSDFYERTNRSYRLFRIKIPKLDEWGEDNNIYVNWNRQGYPNGYDETDLNYIISGLWSTSDDWGEGETSLDNWEEVEDFELNTNENSVSFQITNTDYIYVLSRKLLIEIVDIPLTIRNAFTTLYPNLQIKHASRDGNSYSLYLDNGTYATFSRRGTFEKMTDDNYRIDSLPLITRIDILNRYKGNSIDKVVYVKEQYSDQYEIIFDNGTKAYYNGTGEFIYDTQYGNDPTSLPPEVITYIQQNHPGEVITNVVTKEYYGVDNPYYYYTVYLSSDAKVYFSGANWYKTLYYALQPEDLPDEITQYFTENYANSNFIEINYGIYPENREEFEVYLIDDKWFLFNEQYELIEAELASLEESDLPAPISTFISTHFANKELAEIYYYYYYYGDNEVDETYDVYFIDMLNIEFSPDGTVEALYGQRLEHLPMNIRDSITTNFPGQSLVNCTFNRSGYSYSNAQGVSFYYNWELFFADDTIAGLAANGSVVFVDDFRGWKKKKNTTTSFKKKTISEERLEVRRKFKELKKLN